MLGFSIYLNQEIDIRIENYIKDMKRNGFEGIFTSLHIPEDDISIYKERITKLANLAQKMSLKLMVDVDEKSLNNIGYSYEDVSELKQFGITGIRVDYGLSNMEIANLSKQITVGLNASTITDDDINELKKYNAGFEQLEAWHNYYPRPETGLSFKWYQEKNKTLQNKGFKTMGFVPGDEILRGPLEEELPTLEKHRYKNPLASAIELITDANTDMVYIGDSKLSDKLQTKFSRYFEDNVIEIDVKYNGYTPNCLKEMIHSRKDLSEDVIRVEEGRFNIDGKIKAENCIERLRGAITIDNEKYGRYMGEIQIAKHLLISNEKINIIGNVLESDIELLEVIKAGQAIILNNN